jgi:serine-type D-Ala-D-Ala carboxypeptidase (penicillin-binding protein 5/6)
VRRPLALLAALLLPIAISLSCVPARAAALPRVSAPADIVIDGWSGDALYARNADVYRDPASTVKIMTVLIVLRHHIPMNRIETVSEQAATIGGSTAALYAGERISERNLLYGALLPSGNDAAVALAQSVTPNMAAFIGMMNAEAARLHMYHTHYLTPNGYDVYGQVTTARDLAQLARAAMHWAIFARVVSTKVWSARDANGVLAHTWTNLNQLLWRNGSVDGVKTGTTPGAGACLVSSARRRGKWVIEVNLGSSELTRFTDGAALLNYGFEIDENTPSTR